MSEINKYIDDKIEHIESDLDKIATKSGMYIGALGNQGALHLCKELINNGIDECINTQSPANTIEIFLDEGENTITVSDNGRGIPEESLEIVCTTLQSGSKFTRTGYGGTSAGENGVGMTACNALSSIFEINSYRYGNKHKIRFEEHTKTEFKTTKIKSSDRHGTTVIMKPNPKYLGSNCDIIADDLMEWLDKISYLIPSDIIIKLAIKKKGKESLVNKKYSNKYGLYDLVKKTCNKSLLDPVHFKRDMKMKEQVGDEVIDRFMGIEVALTYDSSASEFDGISFCNFIHTVDNGVHLDACKTATLQYLTKQTKDALSERESKKIDITFADASQGLYLAIYLCTDFQPNFNSQAKAKLTSNEFFKPIRDLTYKALNDYFKDNQKDLKKIIDKIKTNAKARIESTKVRNSVIRGETNNFAEFLMENFIPANDRSKNGYRELIILEGRSARGTAVSGRFDRNTQAIFSIRGVPLNSFNTSLDKVLLNDEFKSLTQILGCNIGSRFDISKLKYDKIILLADADSDGYNITSLLCAFFLTHLPEIIKDGRLYKSVSPLYRIKSKYKEFILNKKEYIQIYEKHIRENLIIEDPDSNKVYNKEEMQELLMITKGYLDELLRLSNHLVIDYTILEYLLIHRHEKNFYKNFKKKFPELEIDDDNVLTGIYEGKYQILIMDKLFEKRIMSLEKFIINQKETTMYFKVRDRNGTEYGTLTLGQFLVVCQKYQPIIKTRYKGVGELNANDLRDNTLDPRNRMLIRLTIDDIEKELEQFNILHGDNADARKLLMQNYKIDREELDN